MPLPLVVILSVLILGAPSIYSTNSSLFQQNSIGNVVNIDNLMIQKSFEIELKETGDVPSLCNESSVAVLGNVQQTPRYNVNGKAWVNAVRVDSTFFDTTLSDRFAVNCTVAKAISMSTHAWVEWTAPILKGTTYEDIQAPDPQPGILFEYGAESGVLQPPWDFVGCIGSRDKTGSEVTIVSSPVRTGSKAMKMYQVSPTKSDAQRRLDAKEYASALEMYYSWWEYFPSSLWESQPYLSNGNDGVYSLGGIQWWFGTQSQPYIYWTGARFKLHGDNWNFQIGYEWGEAAGVEPYSAETEALQETILMSYDMSDYVDQWVHFQIYFKATTDNTGVCQAWFNNHLVLDKTNIKTHPEGYPEWSSKAGYYSNGNKPDFQVEYYTPTGHPESWFFVDDIVVATEKVSETYGVSYP